MIRFLKQTFYTALFVGVIGSFLLRCSSSGQVQTPNEETSSSAPVTAVPTTTEPVHVVSVNEKKSASTADEFRTRTEKILNDLPTNNDIQANKGNEDYHETPKSIVASGRAMGEVMDKMRASKENIPVGLEFYSKCAGDSSIVLQVKALCLRNLRDWEAKLGQSKKVRFAKDVEKLAAKIPKTKF